MLAGRVSGFINVAGRKVQPGEVERVIREIDGVEDVRVLPARDASRGERVAAVIARETSASGSSLTLQSVRAHCARRLAPHKIPRVVVLVPSLPMTARGKVDQRALLALIGAQTVPSA